jgi:hypothetical protein
VLIDCGQLFAGLKVRIQGDDNYIMTFGALFDRQIVGVIFKASYTGVVLPDDVCNLHESHLVQPGK